MHSARRHDTFRALALLQLHSPLPGRAQPQQIAQRPQLLAQVSFRHYPVSGQLLQFHVTC